MVGNVHFLGIPDLMNSGRGKTLVVVSSRTNNAVRFRGDDRIRPKKSTRAKNVLGSAFLITRGSIAQWGHAGDPRHAVFEWGSHVFP